MIYLTERLFDVPYTLNGHWIGVCEGDERKKLDPCFGSEGGSRTYVLSGPYRQGPG